MLGKNAGNYWRGDAICRRLETEGGACGKRRRIGTNVRLRIKTGFARFLTMMRAGSATAGMQGRLLGREKRREKSRIDCEHRDMGHKPAHEYLTEDAERC